MAQSLTGSVNTHLYELIKWVQACPRIRRLPGDIVPIVVSPGGATPSRLDTMCEHEFKGKGLFLGPRHVPARTLDKGWFWTHFGVKGVHFQTFWSPKWFGSMRGAAFGAILESILACFSLNFRFVFRVSF